MSPTRTADGCICGAPFTKYMPWDPSEDGSDRKQRQSASSHPHSHAGLICLLLSLVLRARLAGLASNTLAPLKDVSSLLAGSTPTSSNHQQVQRLIHTRKSSCSSPTPTDLCSSSTNCFRTTLHREVCPCRSVCMLCAVTYTRRNRRIHRTRSRLFFRDSRTESATRS